MGVHTGLRIGAGRQRPHYSNASVRSVRPLEIARAAGSCEWLSVHRVRRYRACADIPGTLRSDRAAGRRGPEHCVAVHVLACRVPPLRDRVRSPFAAGTRAPSGGSRGRRHCAQRWVGVPRCVCGHLRRDGGTPVVAPDHAGQPLHARHDGGRGKRLGVQRRRIDRALAASAAQCARPVADGRHVRLDFRYRVVCGLQQRALRSRLLCRKGLWTVDVGFRVDGAAPRERGNLPPTR